MNIPKIAQVPREILQELVERLKTSHLHGWSFDDHANWLRQKGYPISRSLIHRFCQELREIKSQNPDNTDILSVYLDRVNQSKMLL